MEVLECTATLRGKKSSVSSTFDKEDFVFLQDNGRLRSALTSKGRSSVHGWSMRTIEVSKGKSCVMDCCLGNPPSSRFQGGGKLKRSR